MIRAELHYYVIALVIVVFGFQRLLNPSDQPPNLPNVAITVPRGTVTPINVWLAPQGPDCKAPDGWKMVAAAKYGNAKIESVAGAIADSVHENCNGRPIEGGRLEYSAPGWYRSYDEITVEMQAAEAILWRVKYIVTVAKTH
jgi:hypothetical protein